MAAAQTTLERLACKTAPPSQTAQALSDAHESKRRSWVEERAAKLPPGARVLDIGFDEPAHRELFAHCEYSFFDLRALLESARAPGNAGQYRVPVDDERFDVVVCTSVFEWALYPETALREVTRTLKRGGLLWVAPPLRAAPRGAPPRTAPSLSFAWYAAAFAKNGLDIGDAFAADGLFGELCAACIDAGQRVAEAEPDANTRAQLESLLLHELPLVFAELEARTHLESSRAGIILEARRAAARAAAPAEAAAATAQPAAGSRPPEASVRARIGKPPLRVTYLVTSILGVTGGNMTLLNQVDALHRRGHDVRIVTYSPRPSWTRIDAPVIQVPRGAAMAHHVPPSDVVVATYFQNAHELPRVEAPVKIYYAQGDQFVFDDDTPFPNPEAESARQALKASSAASYRLPGVRLVCNSRNLADAVGRAHGVKADAILPVCTDQTIFRPLRRAAPGSRRRILVVGPDTRGSGVESLAFKGIADVRQGIELLRQRFDNFTVVRV